MLAPPDQPPDVSGSSDIPNVLGEFEDWLLDLVTLGGVGVAVGHRQWHSCPIDLWVQSRKLSWAWADAHPVVREYRRLVEGIHESLTVPIPAYEALAIVSLMKTLFRYRVATL